MQEAFNDGERATIRLLPEDSEESSEKNFTGNYTLSIHED
jgi:hypothetical protein